MKTPQERYLDKKKTLDEKAQAKARAVKVHNRLERAQQEQASLRKSIATWKGRIEGLEKLTRAAQAKIAEIDAEAAQALSVLPEEQAQVQTADDAGTDERRASVSAA